MNSLYKKIDNFYTRLRKEVLNSDIIYKNKAKYPLKAYYTNIQKSTSYVNYIRHYYIQRVLPLIKNVENKKKILDAGCGVGTESILCGIFGGDVLGVDIKKDRLELAKQRIIYYEKENNKKLNIKFKFENIFKISGSFDIIWVNEAISHIDPIDKFLNFCYSKLRRGGKLIIADSNKLNPHKYYKAKMEQKKSGAIIKEFPKRNHTTGEKITYAIERIFSIHSINSLLSGMFKTTEVNYIRFFPYIIYKINPNFIKKFENEILTKLPIIRQFCGTYVIICIKS